MIFTNDEMTFNKCVKKDIVSGKVVTIVNKGEPTEYYLVRTPDGNLNRVENKDVMSSMLVIRAKKISKPKSKKKGCGCK